MKIKEVFTAGGEPTFTYIKRNNHTDGLESKISNQLNSSKVIIIHGPSKLGKTVITKKVFHAIEHFWIDGGVAKSAQGVWSSVLLLADQKYKTNSFNPTYTLDIAQLVANTTLVKNKIPLVIDDFHLLPHNEQQFVVQAIKSLVYNQIPVVFISVPHKILDVVNSEREMNSRWIAIEIPTWDKEDLKKIAIEGFKELNLEYSLSLIEYLANNSFGNPFIMQELCRATCEANHITETASQPKKINSPSDIMLEKIFFGKIAEQYITDEFNTVLNGTANESSSKKLEHEKIDGTYIDIHEAVTRAIALSDTSSPIAVDQLKSTFKAFLKDEPSHKIIITALTKMSALANGIANKNDISRDPILEWDNKKKIIHILDPFLKFYIRWSGKYS